MKLIALSFLIAIAVTQSYGQQLRLFVNGQVKATTRTFNVSEVSSGKRLKVISTDNKLEGTQRTYVPTDIAFDLKDTSVLKKVFKEVFSSQRLDSLLSEKYLYISFYVDPRGYPLEVSFLTPANTTLTSLEIEKLESALKRNVSFKMYGSNLERGNYYEVSYLAKYKLLIQ